METLLLHAGAHPHMHPSDIVALCGLALAGALSIMFQIWQKARSRG